MFSRARIGFGLFCLVAVALGRAAGQDLDPQLKAESDALFHRGVQQLEDGDTYAACESFGASYRLLPRTGTLLNLGICHEQAGQLLLARRELLEVRSNAERDGHAERVGAASERIRSIEGQLGWIHVAPAAETAQLRLDGVPVAVSKNEPFAVMPGEHTVRLEAEGFESREVVVSVGRGQHTNVVFQPLQPRAEPASSAPPPVAAPLPRAREKPAPSSTLSTAALIVGIAGVATSIAFGAWALERKDAVEERCPNQRCTGDSGFRAADTGRAAAIVSTVSFGVGVAGFGGWLVLPGGPLNRPDALEPSAGLTERRAF